MSLDQKVWCLTPGDNRFKRFIYLEEKVVGKKFFFTFEKAKKNFEASTLHFFLLTDHELSSVQK